MKHRKEIQEKLGHILRNNHVEKLVSEWVAGKKFERGEIETLMNSLSVFVAKLSEHLHLKSAGKASIGNLIIAEHSRFKKLTNNKKLLRFYHEAMLKIVVENFKGAFPLPEKSKKEDIFDPDDLGPD